MRKIKIHNIEIIFIRKSDIYCQHNFPVTRETYEENMKDKACSICKKPYEPWRPLWKEILGI